ncbi:hypothetical protein, partial [Plasmodium yoelii yoelii]
ISIITYKKMLCDPFHINEGIPFLVAYLNFIS